MSTQWKILRDDVVIADLATTDVDMEGLQTEGTTIVFAAPIALIPNSSDKVSEYILVVHAYDNSGVYIAGTCTAQFIEKSPYPLPPAPGSDQKYHYVGASPNVLLPFGRGFTIPGRNYHAFTVRISSVVAVGATKIRVLYKHLR